MSRDYITVKISTDDVYNMFYDRLDHWSKSSSTESPEEHDLYMKMYESMIDGGCFDGAVLDVANIVDNDVVNNTAIYYKGDSDFEALKEAYLDGTGYVDGIGEIETVDDDDEPTIILVRF